jgi:hypothetical protein
MLGEKPRLQFSDLHKQSLVGWGVNVCHGLRNSTKSGPGLGTTQGKSFQCEVQTEKAPTEKREQDTQRE